MLPRPASIAVLALAVLVLSAAARGQEADMIPEPVSTPGLMRCADEMQLSPDQRLRIIPFHDAYLLRFERLWQTDVQRFMLDLQAAKSQLESDRPRIPDRRTVEGLIRQYEALLSRVDSLDGTFFDEIGSVLAEEQLPRLQRVRNDRRIHVVGHGAMEVARKLNRGVSVDLPRLLKQLDLTPREQEYAGVIIDGYQGTLLTNIRETRRELKDAMSVLLDTVDELGLRRKSAREMAKIVEDEERRAALREKLDDAAKPLQMKIHAVSRLKLRTLRALQNVLDDENAAELRRLYYEQVYARSDAGPGRWRHRFEKAMALEGLPEESRGQIELQRDSFAIQDDALADRLVDLVEESRRRRGFTLLFDDVFAEPPNPQRQEIEKLRERRKELADSADAALDAILGPELLAVLEPPGTVREGMTVEDLITLITKFAGPSIHSRRSNEFVATNVAIDFGEQTISVPYEQFYSTVMGRAGATPRGAQTMFVHALLLPTAPPDPRPIGDDEFRRYVEMLDLGADDRVVVESLYDDYLAAADEALTDPPEAKEERPEGTDEGAERDPFAIIHQLDEQFFDDAGVALDDEHRRLIVDRLHGIRERTLYRTLTRGVMIARHSDKGYADIAVLICAHAGSAQALRELTPVLDTYDGTATPLLRSRYELAKAAPDSDDWAGAQGQFSANLEQLERINEQTLRAAVDRLPPAASGELRYAYHREAHPSLFAEARDVEAQVAAALGLPDLADSQRERIYEIADRFRGRYRDLCEQLIVLEEAAESESETTPDEELRQDLEYARLDFLKRDAADRARTRLWLTLTEAQIGSVAGLDRAW